MTRKHFKLIAEAVRELSDSLCIADQRLVANVMARTLATTNPRFDRQRFIEACTKPH